MAALLSIRPPPASYIYSSSSALTVSSPSSSTSPASSSHRVQRTTDELHAQLGTKMAIKKGGAAGLKQILKRCSSLGRRQQQQQSQNQGHGWEEEEEAAPSDVPRGHFAVYVGESRRRFVVPIAVLDRPEFRSLLRRAEEEFGFGGAGDLLVLPCEELAFRSLCSASSLPCAADR